MPEKPEVMTVAKALNNRIVNKKIKEVDVLWNNIIATDLNSFKVNIKNQVVRKVTTRGKFIVILLDDFALLVHLRMEGKFFFRSALDPINKHEHVIIKFFDGEEMRYHDTRKFGKMYLLPKDDIYKVAPLINLGYDYYDKDLTTDYLLSRYNNIKKPIKEVLLDQSIIAGIGNIYADEILFKARISPYTPASKLKKRDINDILINTKETLEEAKKLGGTTIKSFTSAEGVHGLFQNKLLVHGKKGNPCPFCNTAIIKEKLAGRGTYYCPKCQKKKHI